MKIGIRGLTTLATLLVIPGVWPAIGQAANTVYVGANYGLFKSTDAGVTWTRVDIPLNNPLLSGPVNVISLSIDPHDASKIYFVGQATAKAFFATADAGKTWSATPSVGFAPSRVGVDFAGQIIYVTATAASTGSDNLLYRSADKGATWTRLKLPNTPATVSIYPNGSPVASFVVDPTVSGTIYALSRLEEDFFKSVDFGSTWTLVSSGKTNGISPQTSILGIRVDPRDPLTWHFMTDHSSFPQTCPLTNGGLCGLFKSTDGGATFTGLSIPSNYVSSVSFGAPTGTAYATADVAGLGGTVMKTTDSGATWTPLKNGLFTPRSGEVWADRNDPSTVFVNDTSSRRDFYVSTDGGAHFTQSVLPPGPPGCVPGNCGPEDVHDLIFAPSSQPVITAVVNAASLQPPIVANSWVSIFGTNLASATDNWGHAIVNGQLPTLLDGVSVTIGGKAAYVYFISPGQINVLAPDIPAGPVAVTVTTAAGASATFTATVAQYSPAFFDWPNSQPVATRQDYSYAVKAGTFQGVTTVAAKPGDVLILWGTGFGPTNPVPPVGIPVPADRTYSTAIKPTVTINNNSVTVYGAALASGAVGLYQVAIQVPTTLADGDWPIQATIGGVQSPTGILLSVHH